MDKKILVVDDDNAFRESVVDILELEGYLVTEAIHGKHGLSLLSQETFDLVITDILMPEMEGVEFMDTISEEYPSLKVIGMTGGGRIGTSEDVKFSAAEFFDTILSKPFSSDDLLAEVKKFLEKSNVI